MSSTRIDFYLLQDVADNEEKASQSKYALACRLIEKAYLRGHKVFVFCNNRQEAETLDELLWTFKEDSFIPHNLSPMQKKPKKSAASITANIAQRDVNYKRINWL